MSELLQEMPGTSWGAVEAWMCSKGFPPEGGCAVVLPAGWKNAYSGLTPDWVRFSTLVNQPQLLNLRAMGMEGRLP